MYIASRMISTGRYISEASDLRMYGREVNIAQSQLQARMISSSWLGYYSDLELYCFRSTDLVLSYKAMVNAIGRQADLLCMH